jgi:precorrin-6A/cobalt-precorrin-6A reductase
MILLFGGTAETSLLAGAFVHAGFDVMVSTATDIPPEVPLPAGALRRTGTLDFEAMKALAIDLGISALVDASHPYAAKLHATARATANELGLPYLRWLRAGAVESDESTHWAGGHAEAALIACSFGRPMLLTIGSTNLGPYVREARSAGIKLVARVLLRAESIEAARRAGLRNDDIIPGRGPFSIEDNIEIIRRFGIGVIVTKDSGKAGGVVEKIEAARRELCEIVVVRRPGESSDGAFDSVHDMIRHMQGIHSPAQP